MDKNGVEYYKTTRYDLGKKLTEQATSVEEMKFVGNAAFNKVHHGGIVYMGRNSIGFYGERKDHTFKVYENSKKKDFSNINVGDIRYIIVINMVGKYIKLFSIRSNNGIIVPVFPNIDLNGRICFGEYDITSIDFGYIDELYFNSNCDESYSFLDRFPERDKIERRQTEIGFFEKDFIIKV